MACPKKAIFYMINPLHRMHATQLSLSLQMFSIDYLRKITENLQMEE